MHNLRSAARSELPLFTILALTPACALTMPPPARSGGPFASPYGLQVAVVGQLCTQSNDFEDDLDSDHADVQVKVEVRNASVDAVTVDRDNFRLIAPDNPALEPLTLGRETRLTVKGGETRSFEPRFQPYGWNQSQSELHLEATFGVTVRDKIVQIGAFHFVPWNA